MALEILLIPILSRFHPLQMGLVPFPLLNKNTKQMSKCFGPFFLQPAISQEKTVHCAPPKRKPAGNRRAKPKAVVSSSRL